jgi:hypothetical protein
MTAALIVLLVNDALAFVNVGLIWMMQLQIYPLWAFVGKAQWVAYHAEHWRRVRWFVFPPVFLQFALAVALVGIRLPTLGERLAWLNLGLQTLTHLLTWRIWAPLQIRLSTSKGDHPRLLSELLRSHWSRTALVTACGLVALWMVVAALP